MANKISGLTVEIGGDTTKLGKAIKDVEAQSRALSKELGDVNKLLKLDLGNTDLLAQKQKSRCRHNSSGARHPKNRSAPCSVRSSPPRTR